MAGFRPAIARNRSDRDFIRASRNPAARPPATRHEHPLPTYEASRSSQLLIDVVQ